MSAQKNIWGEIDEFTTIDKPVEVKKDLFLPAKEVLGCIELVKRHLKSFRNVAAKDSGGQNVYFHDGMVSDFSHNCGFHSEIFKDIKGNVSFSWLSKVLKKLKTKKIRLLDDGKRLYVEDDKKKISMSCAFDDYELSQSIFDREGVVKDDKFYEITDNDIDLIKRSKKFIAKDELRPQLSCTLLSSRGDCVGSDATCLVFDKLSSVPPRDFKTKLIPIESCFISIVTDVDDRKTEYNLYSYENGDFELEDTETTGVAYPNYYAVIPKDLKSYFVMDKKEVLEALDLIEMSSDKVLVSYDGVLVLKNASVLDGSDCKIKIKGTYEDEYPDVIKRNVILSISYVKDFLKDIKENEIMIRCRNFGSQYDYANNYANMVLFNDKYLLMACNPN